MYSAILALTLLVFGVALYSIQAQDTLNSLKQDLRLSSSKLTEPALRMDLNRPPGDTVPRDLPPPPRPFGEFSGEGAFQALREREIVRVLDGNGNLVASPFGRVEDALPLSETGLAALQEGQEWWESAMASGERTLIYSRPIARGGETVSIVQVARSDRTLPIPGFRTVAQVEGNCGALRFGPLTAEQMSQVESILERQ